MPDRIRIARHDDVAALNVLIGQSASDLSVGFYDAQQIESLNRFLFGVDTQLVRDGTYFVVERDDVMIACGGWSARETLYGGDQSKEAADPLLDPATEAARIRAFFVHPAYARQGIGRALLAHCEASACEAGFARAELVATLPGVPLYAALGYQSLESLTRTLLDGVTVDFVRMGKPLTRR